MFRCGLGQAEPPVDVLIGRLGLFEGSVNVEHRQA